MNNTKKEYFLNILHISQGKSGLIWESDQLSEPLKANLVDILIQFHNWFSDESGHKNLFLIISFNKNVVDYAACLKFLKIFHPEVPSNL